MKEYSEKKSPQKIKAVIWDWNGTILNDVHVCVESINAMLRKRNIPLLNYETYREVFSFPVKSYYEKIGFDFQQEPFDVVAIEFIDIYRQHLNGCSIFPETKEILEEISAVPLPQYILSAMEQQLLDESLKEKGIYKYFHWVAGTSDHHANGKIHAAELLQSIINQPPESILLIGDTIHDHEVALEMGWQNILVSNGHQSDQRLKQTGRLVIPQARHIISYLNGHSI